MDWQLDSCELNYKYQQSFNTKLFYARFLVREFNYSEEELHAEKEEMTRLSADKKQQYVSILFLQLNPFKCYILTLTIEMLKC